MAWEICGTDDFEEWFAALNQEASIRVIAAVDHLTSQGPAAKRPIVGEISGSRHKNMKELIVGDIRILFAFDPEQRLVGGNKAKEGWKLWYATAIPRAEELFDEWLTRGPEYRNEVT